MKKTGAGPRGRSQWPRGLWSGSAAARLLRVWVRIPPEAWIFVCCECCVLLDRGLCVGLITRLQESYRLWCVIVCDLETSWMRRPRPTVGCCAMVKKTGTFHFVELNSVSDRCIIQLLVTFSWPCMVINSYNTNLLDVLISQIYFWNKTLHVSDSSSAHHQEFFTVHTANLYNIYHCCVYSENLLMMDRRIVRNM